MDGWSEGWMEGNLDGDAFLVMNLSNCTTESRLKVFVENSSAVGHAIDEHGRRHQTESLSVHEEPGRVEVAKVNLQ